MHSTQLRIGRLKLKVIRKHQLLGLMKKAKPKKKLTRKGQGKSPKVETTKCRLKSRS